MVSQVKRPNQQYQSIEGTLKYTNNTKNTISAHTYKKTQQIP